MTQSLILKTRPPSSSTSGADALRAVRDAAMTIRQEIVFSIFIATAVVMGWKLISFALDYVLT